MLFVLASDSTVFLPSPSDLILSEILMFLMMLVFIPYMGALIGGTILSVLFNVLDKDKPNPIYRRFSREVIDKLSINAWVGFGVTLISLLSIVLLLNRFVYGAPIHFSYHWHITVALAIMGLGSTYLYRKTYSLRDDYFLFNIGAGVTGFKLLIASCFFFTASKNFIIYREVWKTEPPIMITFASNFLTSFGIFMVLSFVITGGAILFFFNFLTRKTATAEDKEYRHFTKKLGLILIAAFTFLHPILKIIDLLIVPVQGMSDGIIVNYMLAMLAGMLTCLAIVWSFLKIDKAREWVLFPLILVSTTVYINNDRLMRDNSLIEHYNVIASEYEKSQLEKNKGKEISEEELIAIGEKVYQNACTACHSVDGSQRIGPSFKNLVGYERPVVGNEESNMGEEYTVVADFEYIKKAIYYPAVELSKGYPNAMIAQNLSETELAGMIAYLKSLSDKEMPEAGTSTENDSGEDNTDTSSNDTDKAEESSASDNQSNNEATNPQDSTFKIIIEKDEPKEDTGSQSEGNDAEKKEDNQTTDTVKKEDNPTATDTKKVENAEKSTEEETDNSTKTDNKKEDSSENSSTLEVKIEESTQTAPEKDSEKKDSGKEDSTSDATKADDTSSQENANNETSSQDSTSLEIRIEESKPNDEKDTTNSSATENGEKETDAGSTSLEIRIEESKPNDEKDTTNSSATENGEKEAESSSTSFEVEIEKTSTQETVSIEKSADTPLFEEWPPFDFDKIVAGPQK